jgi:hypothetical protein
MTRTFKWSGLSTMVEFSKSPPTYRFVSTAAAATRR